ncbi:MAG: hypothetical protein HYY63_01200, partial [Elusimicrobia bacterium]|nr:hypothetical protein [Elusimicrobiota bacterium]
KFVLDSRFRGNDENIQKYLKAFQLEKSLDFKQVESDQKKLLETLSRKLKRGELIELLEESLAYRLGRIGYGEFYEGLKDRSRKSRIALTPEMDRYIGYVTLVEGIDREKLFKELKSLENEAWRIKGTQYLIQIDKDYKLLEKALDFRLNPEEWEEYGKREEKIRNIGERVEMLGGNTTALTLALSNIRKFNELSLQRNQIFVDKLRNRMKEKNVKLGVLVAGGYHSKGVEEKLKEKGISYITIRPKVDMADVQARPHPLHSFKRDMLPLEKMFMPEKVNLASEPALFNEDSPRGNSANGSCHTIGAALSLAKLQKDESKIRDFLDQLRVFYRESETKVEILEKRPKGDLFCVKLRMGEKEYQIYIYQGEDKEIGEKILKDPAELLYQMDVYDKNFNNRMTAGTLNIPFSSTKPDESGLNDSEDLPPLFILVEGEESTASYALVMVISIVQKMRNATEGIPASTPQIPAAASSVFALRASATRPIVPAWITEWIKKYAGIQSKLLAGLRFFSTSERIDRLPPGRKVIDLTRLFQKTRSENTLLNESVRRIVDMDKQIAFIANQSELEIRKKVFEILGENALKGKRVEFLESPQSTYSTRWVVGELQKRRMTAGNVQIFTDNFGRWILDSIVDLFEFDSVDEVKRFKQKMGAIQDRIRSALVALRNA